MKTYEGLFIFADTLPEDKVNALTAHAREEIEKLGGKVSEAVVLGRRAFGRPLSKKQAGQYARVTFQFDTARVAALNDRYKMNDEIFRFQIVRRDKPPAPPAGSETRPAARSDASESAPAKG